MEIVHTLNRGVDKRVIFLDDQDRFRFIHDLFEFNDEEWTNAASYRFFQSFDIASRKIERKPRKLLVDILAFCLMPNHYHLLISPKIPGAIPKFMRKLNMGYAKYFNERYDRSGALFEGRYKSVRVTDEAHFLHLPYYIHFNPLDMHMPEWRKGKIKNTKSALEFLETYRWSSHLDYLGDKNFPSLTNRDLFLNFFDGHDGYRERIEDWLRKRDTGFLSGFTLE